jgi:thioredoxin reductase (NADPH)
MEHFETIILGGGPAGLTAGIYLSRAKVKTLILNQGAIGGQMVLTHEIANYPGVDSIGGYQLSNIMKNQAKNFGCKIRSIGQITELDLNSKIKSVTVDNSTTFTTDSVIIATGGRSRTLGVPGEEEFKGRGISYCATCDGDFFTDKEIIVVGGGNSALEEAVSLTKYAKKLTIVHQFDHFQAFEHAIEEAEKHPKIDFIMESQIAGFYGDEKLQSVDILNLKSNTTDRKSIDGVFIFIGYVPNTEFLKDKLNLNNWGEIEVDYMMKTKIEGVYAAGDCIAKKYRQVSTAVGDGTQAALSVSEYLNELK